MTRRRTVAATLVGALVVVGLLVAEPAAVAAITGGEQPTGAVEQVPVKPSSSAWADAPGRTVTLSKQQMAVPFGGGSVDSLDVKVLSNDTHVAFRLDWTDPTRDVGLGGPKVYSDGAALMFHAGSVPPITMGSVDKPVNIWYWRSNWQYGNLSGGGDMYAYPHPSNETKPGLAANNPVVARASGEYAQSYYAKSFGTLTYAPTQPVRAVAERTEDGWSVVFVRERATDGEFDAQFDDPDSMFVAFAVWNGSADEVNGQKSITLTFSKLDTRTNELSAAQPGSTGTSGNQSTGGAQSAGAARDAATTLFGSEATTWVGGLGALALVVWLVGWWRLEG